MNHARSGGPTNTPSSTPLTGAGVEDEAIITEATEASGKAIDDPISIETDPLAVTQIRDAFRELDRAQLHDAQVLLLITHRRGIETVRLQEGVGIVLGRDPSADVRIREKSLSRRHARFTLSRGDVLVEDLGSTNGTLMKGERVERGMLKPGDEVLLGDITVSLRVLTSAELSLLNIEAPTSEREATKRVAVDATKRVAVDATTAPTSRDQELVLRSAAMRPVLETAMRLARSTGPVLVQGETGTGKDVIAHLIHDSSTRHKKALVCVTCSGVPEALLKSMLFGHEKGAFDGATQAQEGVFESANGGTVVIDEVGDLPASAQAMLLHLLETRRVARLGSTKEVEVDVRVIATTHRDLEAMVESGTFRSDLFYRFMSVRIPPLCERREDIAPLAMHFLHQLKQQQHKVQNIDPDVMTLLEAYSWPGNVRELSNVIERAIVCARGDNITVDDLPENIRTTATQRRSSPVPSRLPSETPPAVTSAIGLKAQMDRLEAEIILDALRATHGNLAMAARRLRMSLRTLQEKITAHGLKRSDFRK